MKGTLEKLRKIFISKRRHEDDISASKFSRSLSFKKASMRRSLRRLTRRKAVVTNHGIIYVEGDPSAPSTPTPANYAAAFAFGPRPVSAAAAGRPQEDRVRVHGGDRRDSRGVTDSGGTGPVRHRSVSVSGAGGASRASVSPCAQRAARRDAGARRRSPSVSPSPVRLRVPRLSPGPTPAARGRACSTGNIPTSPARPRTHRRPTDSLPRIPTETEGASSGVLETGRRASHCGVYRAFERPLTIDLVGRTARIMSLSLTPTKALSDAGSARSDAEDELAKVEGYIPVSGYIPVNGGRDRSPNARNTTVVNITAEVASDANRQAGGVPQTPSGDPRRGTRRRLPTVTATRDHLRRSLRRLSERRRRSRRPESLADTPTASGLDFYKMFSRVPPVLAPGTSIPTTPFTFSRRNPVTQWLAESEQAQRSARKAPSVTDWDALLWSELMSPPAGEKEARGGTKNAGRTRRSGVRTSSEASRSSGGRRRVGRS